MMLLQGDENFYEEIFRLGIKMVPIAGFSQEAWLSADQNGKALQVIGCHVDITEQKEYELGLLTSERRFRSLAESSQDIIILFNCDYQVVYINQAGLKSLGLNEEEVIGKSPKEIFSDPILVEEFGIRFRTDF